MLQEIREKDRLDVEEKVELTASLMPSTTLSINRVEIPRLGFRVYDTPGVMSPQQPYNVLHSLEALKIASKFSKNSLVKVPVKKGESLWLGGLIRIDILSVC